MGFLPLATDSGIYYKDGTYIAIYVDDLLIIGQDKERIRELKEALNQRFHMSDLGPCSFYLGIRIQRDRPNRKITLDQEAYIDKILQQFNFDSGAANATPMATTTKLEKAPLDYECDPGLRRNYQSAVGSLMYLMLSITRVRGTSDRKLRKCHN